MFIPCQCIIKTTTVWTMASCWRVAVLHAAARWLTGELARRCKVQRFVANLARTLLQFG